MKITEVTGTNYKEEVLHSITSRLKRNFPNDTTTVAKITGLRKNQFWTDVLEPRIAKRDYPELRSLDYWKMIDELIDLLQKTKLPLVNSIDNSGQKTQLNELADQPYPFKFIETEYEQLAKAEFTTKNGLKYIVIIVPGSDENGEEQDYIASIEFSYRYVDMIVRHTQKIMNTGDAFRIFSTVGNIVKDFLQHNPQITQFDFGADKREPSRVKMYTTMAKVLPKYIPNFKLADIEDGYSYKYFHFKKT